MSPSPICSYKTFRAKSTNRAIRTTAGLMMLGRPAAYAIALAGPNSDSSAVIEAIRRRPNSTEDIR